MCDPACAWRIPLRESQIVLLQISKDYPDLDLFSHFALRDADGGDWRQDRIELTATIAQPCPGRIEVLKCDYGDAPAEAPEWRWKRDTERVKVLDGGGPAIELMALNAHGAAVWLPKEKHIVKYRCRFWADHWGDVLTSQRPDGTHVSTAPATEAHSVEWQADPGETCLIIGPYTPNPDSEVKKLLRPGDFVTMQAMACGNAVTAGDSAWATLRFKILPEGRSLSCNGNSVVTW